MNNIKTKLTVTALIIKFIEKEMFQNSILTSITLFPRSCSLFPLILSSSYLHILISLVTPEIISQNKSNGAGH